MTLMWELHSDLSQGREGGSQTLSRTGCNQELQKFFSSNLVIIIVAVQRDDFLHLLSHTNLAVMCAIFWFCFLNHIIFQISSSTHHG